jgi:hypothetical protein
MKQYISSANKKEAKEAKQLAALIKSWVKEIK